MQHFDPPQAGPARAKYARIAGGQTGLHLHAENGEIIKDRLARFLHHTTFNSSPLTPCKRLTQSPWLALAGDASKENKVLTFLELPFVQRTVLFVGYGLEELEILEYIIVKSRPLGQTKGTEIRHYMLQGFFAHQHELMVRPPLQVPTSPAPKLATFGCKKFLVRIQFERDRSCRRLGDEAANDDLCN